MYCDKGVSTVLGTVFQVRKLPKRHGDGSWSMYAKGCALVPMPSPSSSHLDKTAIDKLHPGDAVVIFTPDSRLPLLASALAYTDQ